MAGSKERAEDVGPQQSSGLRRHGGEASGRPQLTGGRERGGGEGKSGGHDDVVI